MLNHATREDLVLVEISKSGITAQQLQTWLRQTPCAGTVWAYHLHPTLLVKRTLYEMGVEEVLGPDTDNLQKIAKHFQSTEIT